jgi:hypothetical protein
MKKAFVSVLFMASFLMSGAAFAGGTLIGADADNMAKILNDSGIAAVGGDFASTSAQNVVCVGMNFQNICSATFADSLPAAKPIVIKDTTGDFWSLLKKAGANTTPSAELKAAGISEIRTSRIDCCQGSNCNQDPFHAPAGDYCTIQ